MKLSLRSAPIFVQLLALAILSLAAAQLVNLAVVLTLPDPPPPGFTVAEAARALQGHPIVTRSGHRLTAQVQAAAPDFSDKVHADTMNTMIAQALAQTLNVPTSRVRVALEHSALEAHTTLKLSTARDRIEKHLREHTEIIVHMTDPHAGPNIQQDMIAGHMASMIADNAFFPAFSAAYQRPDGRWSVVEPPQSLLSPWQLRLIVSFLASAAVLTLIAWLVARRLARPIHAFAVAAERLGGDPHAPPLTSQGPAEVRTAVAAFNDMQDKLRRYVSDRTLMIAAIAHDLRTPLMRLRFRVEAAPDEVRARAVADIEQMDAMISAALAYARGESLSADRTRLDLSALASAVAADLAETGKAVSFTPPTTPVLVMGDSMGLRRLLANLLDNAVKFGGGARMSLAREGGSAVIHIDDDGPGLPNNELERVFDPFYRPDVSRSAETGGFGLGLAAARSAARAHGGEVTLTNRSEGGLRATVTLPALD